MSAHIVSSLTQKQDEGSRKNRKEQKELEIQQQQQQLLQQDNHEQKEDEERAGENKRIMSKNTDSKKSNITEAQIKIKI